MSPEAAGETIVVGWSCRLASDASTTLAVAGQRTRRADSLHNIKHTSLSRLYLYLA